MPTPSVPIENINDHLSTRSETKKVGAAKKKTSKVDNDLSQKEKTTSYQKNRSLNRINKKKQKGRKITTTQEKISKKTTIVMTALTLAVDIIIFLVSLLHFYVGLGSIIAFTIKIIINIIIGLIFTLWFKKWGVFLLSPKKLIRRLALWTAAYLPIPFYPGWTFSILYTIACHNSETVKTLTRITPSGRLLKNKFFKKK